MLCLLFAVVGLLRRRGGGVAPARSAGRTRTARTRPGRRASRSWCWPIPFGSGWRGPRPCTGVLFAIAPLAGVPLSGLLVPGQLRGAGRRLRAVRGLPGTQGAAAGLHRRGHGPGRAVASVVVARRRPLTWMLVLLAAVSLLAVARFVPHGRPAGLSTSWLPWRSLSTLPVLKEILPDQFAPFITLFLGVPSRRRPRRPPRMRWPTALLAGAPPRALARARATVVVARGGVCPGLRHLRRTATRGAGAHAALHLRPPRPSPPGHGLV